MDFLFELAALTPDNGLALEGDMEPGVKLLSGLMLPCLLIHIVGLLGYFAFPLVCLRLVREFKAQRPGWKNIAASVAIGIILAVACQMAVHLPLYFQSVHSQPLYQDDNAFLLSLTGQMAAKQLGPILLSVPVFSGLRKLLRKEGLGTLASGFGWASQLVFFVPFAGFMLFRDYVSLLADPELLIRPAQIYLFLGLAAVPVFLLLLRSLVRQAKTIPGSRQTAAIAAYIATPLFLVPAGLFILLAYAGQELTTLWPDTAIQTLADFLLIFLDPLWKPLFAALAAAGILRLCTGRVISSAQGMLAKKIVFLYAAAIYIITACQLFLAEYTGGCF